MTITYRPGTLADVPAIYRVFNESITDLSVRINAQADNTAGDFSAWERRRPLFEHLTHTAAHFWLAEAEGEVIGYARSIQRGPLLELTEFFVVPGKQSGGVGKAMLARAFPADQPGASERAIIATIDARAQAQYLRAGVYPRFPIYPFSRAPEPVTVPDALTYQPLGEVADPLALVGALDETVLGHRRDLDQAWLQTTRQGYAYWRDGRPVGYGYLGKFMGPFALLDPADFPAVLAHAEATWHAQGHARIDIELPLINQAAVDYLLRRGYRMDSFFAFFMTNVPFGKFEHYICTSPLFFI
jgi:GNAT superfamily N-acetyltransferase